MPEVPSSRRQHWYSWVIGIVAVILGSFAIVRPAFAAADWVYSLLGEITGLFVSFLGNVLIKIIDMIVRVAGYNDFGNAIVVNVGWVVIRDVSNMFFIIILLVIAFGTVLKWEPYRYNRLLGNLVLMAILINFSKFIALFFIDVSQVIMLTFVHAFQDAAAGNFTAGFGVKSIVEFAQAGVGDVSLQNVVLALFLAVIMLLIAVIVSLIILLMLIQRILAFWLLVVMSPVAYLAAALPAGKLKQFNSTWWNYFGKYWLTGPLLAFFLWLALTVIAQTSGNGANETASIIPLNTAGESRAGEIVTLTNGAPSVAFAASAASTTENIFNFIVVTGILMAAVVSAQQLGGMAGGFAGAAFGKIQQVGTRWAKRAGIAAGVVAAPGLAVKGGLGYLGLRYGLPALGRKVDEKAIQPLTKIPLGIAGAALSAIPGLGKTRWVKGIQRAAETGVSVRPSYWKEAWKNYAAQRGKEKGEVPKGNIQDVLHIFISRQKTDYATQAKRRRWREEEAKNETEESSELINKFKDAQGTKDVQAMAGAIRKGGRGGDYDDFIRNLGYEATIVDDEERWDGKKGVKDIYSFIDEELVRKGGMSHEDAELLANDLSRLAESNRQWGLARTHFKDINGNWARHKSRADWARARDAQRSKRDPQVQVREDHRTSYVVETAVGIAKREKGQPPKYVAADSPEAVDHLTVDTGKLQGDASEVLGTLPAFQWNRMNPNAKAELFLNHAKEWLQANPDFYARVWADFAAQPAESQLRWRDITPRLFTKDAQGNWEEQTPDIRKPDFSEFIKEEPKNLLNAINRDKEWLDREHGGKEITEAELKEIYENDRYDFTKFFQTPLDEMEETKKGLVKQREARGAARPSGPPPLPEEAEPVILSRDDAEAIVRNPGQATIEQREALGGVYGQPDVQDAVVDLKGAEGDLRQGPLAELGRGLALPMEEFRNSIEGALRTLQDFQDSLIRSADAAGQSNYADALSRSVIDPVKNSISNAFARNEYQTKGDQQRLLDELIDVIGDLSKQVNNATKAVPTET